MGISCFEHSKLLNLIFTDNNNFRYIITNIISYLVAISDVFTGEGGRRRDDRMIW
jgi:hypothetical protein